MNPIRWKAGPPAGVRIREEHLAGRAAIGPGKSCKIGDSCQRGIDLVEWIAALDTIETLHPHAVIAGHKRPGTDDAPRIIEETRQYIRAIDRLAQTTTTARELYDQMLSLYPERVNPGALWSSAHAIKPEEGKTASGTPWLKPEA